MLHQMDILPKTDKTGIPVYILKFQNRQYGHPRWHIIMLQWHFYNNCDLKLNKNSAEWNLLNRYLIEVYTVAKKVLSEIINYIRGVWNRNNICQFSFVITDDNFH